MPQEAQKSQNPEILESPLVNRIFKMIETASQHSTTSPICNHAATESTFSFS
jgi:hypothetical protein